MYAAYVELVEETRAEAHRRHAETAARSPKWRRIDALVDRAAAAITAAGGTAR